MSPDSLLREVRSAEKQGACIQQGLQSEGRYNCREYSSEWVLYYSLKCTTLLCLCFLLLLFWLYWKESVIAPRSPKITSVNYPLQLIYFSFWKKDGRRNRD